jgi:isoamyl acetate esterase
MAANRFSLVKQILIKARAKCICCPLLIVVFLACSSGPRMLRNNSRIVFFGDSITELGVQPKGYVTVIRDELLKQYPSIQIVGAGVSGNKVPDLQSRLERDVIAKNPTIVFIYIGINDVWHTILPGLQGTPKDRYETGLKEIIGRIQRTGARVFLCTPTVIGEKKNGGNPLDVQLEEYAEISRRVAEETGSGLCDLRRAFAEYLKIHNPEDGEKGILTYDGVHMIDEGNRLIAREMLKRLKE